MELEGRAPSNPDGVNYRPGNRDDFDRLYVATYPRIFRTLAGMLGDPAAAEDCTQEAFLRALGAWPRWRHDAPPEAWLHRIAINAAMAHRRKQRVREVGNLVRRLGAPVEKDPYDETPDPSLRDELRRLPPQQAAALILRHVHGYSNREIGAALGVPESTVASRLMAARRRLRARLDPSMSQHEVASSPSDLDTSDRLRISLNE